MCNYNKLSTEKILEKLLSLNLESMELSFFLPPLPSAPSRSTPLGAPKSDDENLESVFKL